MTPIALSLQTLYAELVQQVHAAPAETGSVYTQTIKGIDYLYLSTTVGERRRHRFLGRADDPSAQSRAADAGRQSSGVAERRRLVSILRAQRIPAPTIVLGRVLDACADAGLFRQAVLVGTGAYQCYAPVVGAVLPSASLTTQDADLATASLAIAADEGDDTLETILKRADRTFTPILGLDPRKPSARFRSATGFMVDILAPQLRRSDATPIPLPRLQAGAIPLQHLGWLIEEPIEAVALHGAGVPVRIPQPARYAVHKLIIAQKRGAGSGKRQKDLMQAGALIEAMRHSDPWALADVVEDARKRGREGWRKPIERSLAELEMDLGVTTELPVDGLKGD